MPVYENTQPPFSVAPGEPAATLVSNADGAGTLGAGKFSERVAIQDAYGMPPRPVVVTFEYPGPGVAQVAPAAVQYDIYAALDDGTPPGTWTKVGSTTNVNGDQVTLQRNAAGGNQFGFICVKEVISPGVKATVQVRQ